MSISDRIYLILADGTSYYQKLEKLTGPASSSLKPSIPSDEYTSKIKLNQAIEPAVDSRFAVYNTEHRPSTLEIHA
jgi:hypothetical protein